MAQIRGKDKVKAIVSVCRGARSFGNCSAWEGGQMTYLVEGRVCLGDRG